MEALLSIQRFGYRFCITERMKAHRLLGNACILLHIGGFGSAKLYTQNSLESEIRRRRLWACYLMQCQLGEHLSLFDPITDISNLTLPWPEADFDAGVCPSLRSCLTSHVSNGGIYSELVKALTLW